MSMRLRIEELAPGGPLVEVSGSITEEADFRPLIQLATSGTLHLDLADVDQINSCGTREWIHFVAGLGRTGRSFELLRCSPAIVRQLNMISNFRGAGKVRSVILPYFCAGCGQQDTVLLALDPGKDLPQIPDLRTCSACGETAEFDDLPDSYLSFTH
jgi:anti-anti-sigma regulatory factor